jgi:hypothetical protein
MAAQSRAAQDWAKATIARSPLCPYLRCRPGPGTPTLISVLAACAPLAHCGTILALDLRGCTGRGLPAIRMSRFVCWYVRPTETSVPRSMALTWRYVT